jgi:hypothetical protein
MAKTSRSSSADSYSEPGSLDWSSSSGCIVAVCLMSNCDIRLGSDYPIHFVFSPFLSNVLHTARTSTYQIIPEPPPTHKN